MKISLYSLLSISLLSSYSQLSAMEDQQALPVDSKKSSLVASEHFDRIIRIQALARSLESSLNADTEYYDFVLYKYKTTNTDLIKEWAAKADLIKPTRHALKAIMKLTAIADIDITILENVISAMPPFTIKYVAGSTENLPGTAKSKKLVSGYSVKDDTRNYQQAMLCALHGSKGPFYPIIAEPIL